MNKSFAKDALNGIWYKYYTPSFCHALLGKTIKNRPKTTRIDDSIEYTSSSEIKFNCWSFDEELKQRQLTEFKIKKQKCQEYGFKDDTDGMGLCLIELDKLAKLEEQILAIEKRNDQIYLQNQQQIAYQKRQREAQALINLGTIISGAGIPQTNTPDTKISNIYPDFSSTLTIPSNQICPILSTPVTNQEVIRGNRICYYQ